MASVMIGIIAPRWRGRETEPTVYWNNSPALAATGDGGDGRGGVDRALSRSARCVRCRRSIVPGGQFIAAACCSHCCRSAAIGRRGIARWRVRGRGRRGPAKLLHCFALVHPALVRLRGQARIQLRLHHRPRHVERPIQVLNEADRPAAHQRQLHLVPIVVRLVLDDRPPLDHSLPPAPPSPSALSLPPSPGSLSTSR